MLLQKSILLQMNEWVNVSMDLVDNERRIVLILRSWKKHDRQS
jgi:hypothetical protein